MHYVFLSRALKFIFSKLITARKRSCGKVMFLHLSVILLGGVSQHAPGPYYISSCTGWLALASWCLDSIQVTSNEWWDRSHETPPPPTVTARAVSILLECILVKLRSEPNLFFGENKSRNMWLCLQLSYLKDSNWFCFWIFVGYQRDLS